MKNNLKILKAKLYQVAFDSLADGKANLTGKAWGIQREVRGAEEKLLGTGCHKDTYGGGIGSQEGRRRKTPNI